MEAAIRERVHELSTAFHTAGFQHAQCAGDALPGSASLPKKSGWCTVVKSVLNTGQRRGQGFTGHRLADIMSVLSDPRRGHLL